MRRGQQLRAENLRQIAMPCDFVQRSTFYFDVFNFRPLWSISRVLSLFIDNSSNAKEVAVTIFHSGQVIIAQPKTQGYYPVLSYSDTFAMSISSMNSSDTATVYACNYMVPPGSWGPNQTQPISGSVSVTNFPATQTVSGEISVSNFPDTQPISGDVSVSNFPFASKVSFLTNFKSTTKTNLVPGPYKIVGLSFQIDTYEDTGVNQLNFIDTDLGSLAGFFVRSPLTNMNPCIVSFSLASAGTLQVAWVFAPGASAGGAFITAFYL